jgi:hypothetical protein
VTGVEQTYHRLNAETPIDPKVYLSKFDHIIDLLGDYGVKVYRVSQHEQYSVQEKGELIAEYDHYVNEHRTNPKPYEALDHDICVWLTLQTKRSQARAALDAGALFLTNDVIFHNFDWRVLRRENIGTVVLPGQLLQVLRPFVPSTDDLDLRFVEAFAAPEFRTTHNDYQETAAKVLSYLTIYKDIPEVTAIKVLTDELLLCQLQGADADSGAFGELVENALVQQNALLLEEKEAMARQLETERVAAAQQIATAAAELEANKAAIGLAEAAAEAREEKAREEERLAVQRVADEKVEASRSEAERLRTELRQKDRRHFVFHLVVAAIGLLLGWAAILLVPHLTNWQWLHTNSGRNGLYGCALIAWGAVCWTVAKPSHYKTALLPIAFAAVLVGLTLVR